MATFIFGVMVHAVLTVAHLSEPSATTVSGLTLRRLWASAAAIIALAAVAIGGVSVTRPKGRFGNVSGRLGSVALVAGLTAVANGGLNLAVATSGPGSGNGVVGAAAALVLGLIAMVLGAIATLAVSRR